MNATAPRVTLWLLMRAQDFANISDARIDFKHEAPSASYSTRPSPRHAKCRRSLRKRTDHNIGRRYLEYAPTWACSRKVPVINRVISGCFVVSVKPQHKRRKCYIPFKCLPTGLACSPLPKHAYAPYFSIGHKIHSPSISESRNGAESILEKNSRHRNKSHTLVGTTVQGRVSG